MFGILKENVLNKLEKTYNDNGETVFKKEFNQYIKTIKENKDFKEMYLFYEEIEGKYIEDKETAKLYVEGLNTYFGQPMGNWNDLNVFCESLHNKLGNVEVKINELYESLDILSERD